MLESREMELQEFEPAPRLTEADRIGDMMSLDRQLDGVLYLLVKKQREEHAWQMPQGGVEGEESLVEVRTTSQAHAQLVGILSLMPYPISPLRLCTVVYFKTTIRFCTIMQVFGVSHEAEKLHRDSLDPLVT